MSNKSITIDSVQNSQLKALLKLWKEQTKASVAEFVVEGDHLCALANQEKSLRSLWLTAAKLKKLSWTPLPEVKIYIISDKVAQKIGQVQHSSGIIGVCDKPSHSTVGTTNLLVIDHLQDPGNLGTLMRSATAFNFLTIVASADSVSFYNPKVLRATQGLIFRLNLVTADIETFLINLKKKNYQIIGTFLHHNPQSLKTFVTTAAPLALLIGNEGQGLQSKWLKLIDHNLIIPMHRDVESLNAAVAGSIMMYQLGHK